MNRLSKESSPYLLQHAHNPIDWYPWGEEAFEKARNENKLIFLSIGYSSCYWCHFMEKDCFEKLDVAEKLNRSYVSIKVDREERPDVDAIYMKALIKMKGSGGWPISMFLTPKLKPFFGASTIGHQQFLVLLDDIQNTWRSNPKQIDYNALQLTNHLKENEKTLNKNSDISLKDLNGLFIKQVQKRFDSDYGGFGTSPKFPNTSILSTLLAKNNFEKDGEIAREIVDKTIKAWSFGGMHDILGGGFHRYCVDQKWEVPHFEKMLYDNANITRILSESHKQTSFPLYLELIQKTTHWLITEMASPKGGFYSSYDAGDINEEGEYYAWQYQELKNLLDENEFNWFIKQFSITTEGNFEHSRNILNLRKNKPYPLSGNDKLIFKAIQKKLLDYKQNRKKPRLDDKIIVSWNGLTLTSLCESYLNTKDQDTLSSIIKTLNFLYKNLQDSDGSLYRIHRIGKSSQRGNLDDYSFLIEALIKAYSITLNEKWLLWAKKLQDIQIKYFWDEEKSGFFYADRRTKNLLTQSKPYHDGSIQSSNSTSIQNLYQLSQYFLEASYMKKAQLTLKNAPSSFLHSPYNYSSLIKMANLLELQPQELVIIVKNKSNLNIANFYIQNKPLNAVVAVATSDRESQIPLISGKKTIGGKTTFYLCEKGVCLSPTLDEDFIKKSWIKV